ncbi:hypothetical protein Cgig2_014995 [Carnegiea gigantea]|uniref:Uncharacterized protein n=1 Tax=Carnegiea gigantea TaxID=171969 RepID=A0A9Q1KI48_9CARY|nr:hypothetical protein Cgig2_014995 [Carnegiea gigantea]
MWSPGMEALSVISSINFHWDIPFYGFAFTNEMAQHVAYHFEWVRRGVAFPPLPLPNDFQALCPSYELAVAEEFAQCFELPELPQVIFYAILLKEAERLGVLHGRTLRIIKRRGGALHAPLIMAFPPLHGTKKMADFMREPLRWHWRSATCPPCLLPDDYQDLCPRFTLPDVEKAAVDFEVPKMVQATFYAILLNDVVGLGIVSGFIVVDLKLTLEGLRWTSFEAWLSHNSRELLEV